MHLTKIAPTLFNGVAVGHQHTPATPIVMPRHGLQHGHLQRTRARPSVAVGQGMADGQNHHQLHRAKNKSQQHVFVLLQADAWQVVIGFGTAEYGARDWQICKHKRRGMWWSPHSKHTGWRPGKAR